MLLLKVFILGIKYCNPANENICLLYTSRAMSEMSKCFIHVLFSLPGLLWNLSSVDNLKPDLLKTALPVLMERVILPYTNGCDQTESEAEAFFHTTGCVR